MVYTQHANRSAALMAMAALLLIGATACCKCKKHPPAALNEFVYVGTSSAVAQYQVTANGTLAPLTPPTVPAGAGPDQMLILPDASFAYVTNVQPN